MMQSKMSRGWSLLRSSKFLRYSCLLNSAVLCKPPSVLCPSLYPTERRSKLGPGLWKWGRTLYSVSHLAAAFPTILGDSGRKPKRTRSSPMLPASTSIEISQVFLPDDINSLGSVHGGVLLKLIEQAGHIVATRHCNSAPESKPVTTLLVRVEHMDFHLPMYVAEVAQIKAAVTFTSEHSVEVTVDAWAENVTTGERTHTNSARLWYVAVPERIGHYERNFETIAVPPLEGLNMEEMELGKQRYLAQKDERGAKKKANNDLLKTGFCHYHGDWAGKEEPQPHTPPASRTTLANIVLPSDCTLTGHMMAGPLMKTMDNAASICAARHSRSPAVTISLDAINFYQPILNGDVYFVVANMIFTGKRSMHIEVQVEAEGLQSGSRRITNSAYFTFVSLDKIRQVSPVPRLKLQTAEQKAKYEARRIRYEEQERQRLQK